MQYPPFQHYLLKERLMHVGNTASIALRISAIVAALSFGASAYFPDPAFLPHADSLFALASDSQVTSLRTKKEGRTYFMVTTCKTIQAPFATIAPVLENVNLYPERFSFITKVMDINEGDGPVKMLVGGYGLYRVYFFGKIMSECSADSSRYRVFCGDVEQKKYRKAWRKRVRGMIKIGSYSTEIFWRVEKRGDTSCRVALTASQAFTTRIPKWMVSTGTNKIFRGMLKDLEKYVTQKTMAGETNTAAPSAAQTVPAQPPAEQQAPPSAQTPAASPPADTAAAPPAAPADFIDR